MQTPTETPPSTKNEKNEKKIVKVSPKPENVWGNVKPFFKIDPPLQLQFEFSRFFPFSKIQQKSKQTSKQTQNFTLVMTSEEGKSLKLTVMSFFYEIYSY